MLAAENKIAVKLLVRHHLFVTNPISIQIRLWNSEIYQIKSWLRRIFILDWFTLD